MSMTTWKSEDIGSYVEVTPTIDTYGHYAGDECWCNPKTEYIDGKAMVSHHIFDECKSYNTQKGVLPEVVLQRPDWLPDGERVNGVPVDYCLVPTIVRLWANGIKTLGSCCGHGKDDPSLVISLSDKSNLEKIFNLIAERDSRSYTISWWENGKLQSTYATQQPNPVQEKQE